MFMHFVKLRMEKKFLFILEKELVQDVFLICLKKKTIEKSFDQLFSNLLSKENIKEHEYDKTGESKQYQKVYYFGKGSKRDNHIRIECDNWSDKIKQEQGFNDGLNVVFMTTEILDWVYSGYK